MLVRTTLVLIHQRTRKLRVVASSHHGQALFTLLLGGVCSVQKPPRPRTLPLRVHTPRVLQLCSAHVICVEQIVGAQSCGL